MSAVQQSKASQFVSLQWARSCVAFLFSLLAIASEPLLAAGIVLSAIDFLQRGQLLAHNPMLAGAWAIAQGLAMEVSAGPLLNQTLAARAEGDTVKVRLYGVLTAFVAIVGGSMLFLQFIESIMQVSEKDLPGWLLISLFIVRTIASVGIIMLACTKQARFSGNAGNSVTNQLPANQPAAPVIDIAALIEQLDERYNSRLETIIEQVVTRVTVSIAQDTGPVIQALPAAASDADMSLQRVTGDSETLIERLVASLPGVSRQDIEQVVLVYADCSNRKDVQIKLGWFGRKYTETLKPILDSIDSGKATVTALPVR